MKSDLQNVWRIVVVLEEHNTLWNPSHAMVRKLLSEEIDGHRLEAAEIEVIRVHRDSVLDETQLEMEGYLVTCAIRHLGFQLNISHSELKARTHRLL